MEQNIETETSSSLDLNILQKSSFWVFLGLGFAYILFEILRTNGYAATPLAYIQKSLDLPFAFTAILYSLSSVRLAFESIESKIFSQLLVLSGFLLFAALCYLNFFLQDA